MKSQPLLEQRTLIELRNIASGMGAAWEFNDDRPALIGRINAYLHAQIPRPAIPEPLEVNDRRLSIAPAKQIVSQREIMDGLQPYIARGLRVRFPTADTWLMDCVKKQDSGTVYAPLRDIVRCARELLK